MSDDLVKQLRNKSSVFYEYVPWHEVDDKDLPDKAADRIEELEAKLEEALEMALEECGFRMFTDSYNNWWQERRNRVAELKGAK